MSKKYDYKKIEEALKILNEVGMICPYCEKEVELHINFILKKIKK